MHSEDIGLVCIGRNEGDRLVACLNSIELDAGNIVYVDSGSTDRSIEVAEGIGAHVVRLDLSRPFTAARARNEGFLALKALRPEVRLVQFVDGDCALAPGWLEAASAFLDRRDDVAVACGRRRERRPEASIYNYLCDLEWNTPVGEAAACGGDALMRVAAFDSVNGYRPDLIAGEEPELCLRLRERGWKIWRLDAEMTRHDAAMSRFRQWWLRTVRCGYAYANVYWLHRNAPLVIWKRETFRAVLWGGVLPAIILLGALVHPIFLLAGVIYLAQICRMALRDRPVTSRSWSRAVLSVVGKFAEFDGILKYIWRKRQQRAAELIEYK
jgi:GT2 family glycosyltransferase